MAIERKKTEHKDKVVFLLGPTAVGKSFFAIKMAQIFDGEIISADSVQVFKGLDIGSAKITKDEMQGVVHYGIDICKPCEDFSAYEFAQFTKKKIKEISQRGKLPIVVGGTGLYIKALTQGFNFGGVEKDESLRLKLQKIAKEQGNDALFEMLKKQNPEVAKNIDRFNTVRLVRALEIALSQGEKRASEVEIDPLVIALDMDRAKLYERINLRVDEMLQSGLVDEVKRLKESGLNESHQSMHAIGYKEVLQFLDEKLTYDEMTNLIKQHTRNYAKRQWTFLRKMDCTFVNVENRDETLKQIEKMVKEFLK